MVRKRTSETLTVSINGLAVGELTKATTGAISFQYGDDWLSRDVAFPISLSLPLREDAYSGGVVTAVFENLLPDNADILRRLAERNRAEGSDAFSVLSAIGRDCVGAMQFTPPGTDLERPGYPEGRALTENQVADLIRGLRERPLGTDVDRDFRISIAGAQEKTALLKLGDEWLAPIGASPTTHIIKPQIGQLPNGIDLSNSVENEFLCSKICSALGLEVANASIESFEDQRVLLVERFDRQWTKDNRLIRLPQEDACQALSVPPTLKYERDGGPGIVDLVGLMRGSDDFGAVEDFMRSQIIFWALGATDGHAKNYSVFLKPRGGYSMTPFYDVLSVTPHIQAAQLRRSDAKLAMAVGNNRHYRLFNIAPRHFLQSAKRGDISEKIPERIFEDLLSRVSKIEDALKPYLAVEGAEQFFEGVLPTLKQRIASWDRTNDAD